MASAYPENSLGIFYGKYLFTKLVADHATNHKQNVVHHYETNIFHLHIFSLDKSNILSKK